MSVDIIGDIHGHADKLVELLTKLGYSKSKGSYQHTERSIVFVGDYIDRGPQIKETLEIVRNMVDAGSALALMGNHEYNAICFHREETQGGHLRKHQIKNILQHYETLRQFKNEQKLYEDYIDWFLTLPLFYETPSFRVVHACWDDDHIKILRSNLNEDRLVAKTIKQSVIKESSLFRVIDETLKGKEVSMPPDQFFLDKDGNKRSEIRIKWWENPMTSTYKEMSVEPLDQLPESRIDVSLLSSIKYYGELEKPVFFGHYWLRDKPMLYRNNICCLDYSVAKQGYLVAYRYDNESALDSKKFVFV